MYHSYFGLDDQVFSIAVNPRYLYMSTQHKEALAHLLYGVNRGGFVMLSGEVGTGKTTIIRCLLQQLPDNADVAFVMNPSASAPDLLCSICDEFGVAYERDERSLKVLTDLLTQFLLNNHGQQRKSIVMIDEAQLLKVSTLEQVRLLTNLETHTEKLLQIILVGQPELNELLARPALRQLSQRITARYHLRPLLEGETDAYIKHRLRVGGLAESRNPFPLAIVGKIHRLSRGIPRVVNVLCDRMLLGVYSKGVTQVDNGICNQAIVEVFGSQAKAPANQDKFAIYMGSAVLVLLITLVLWLLLGSELMNSSSESIGRGVETVSTDGTTSAGTEGSFKVERRLQQEVYWDLNQDRALEALLTDLGIDYSGTNPCWSIERNGFHCEVKHADNWSAFLDVDRPAVLVVTTPGKQVGYVTLVGVKGNEAWLRVAGTIKKVPLSVLGTLWTGGYVFIWQKPATFKEAIGKGSQGELVAWVAKQFATLDKQDTPITNKVFTEQLKKRVEIFQRKHGLEDDGFVGLQTLLKINEELGVEKSLTALSKALDGGL